MNVVMLSRTLPGHGPGGLGASAWDLAQALAEAGARVRVMAPRGAAASNNANLDVQLLPAPPGRYARAWWRESVRGFNAEAQGADVVLGVSAAANALAARRRGGRPAFVFQAHGTSAGELASRLRSPRPRALAGAVRQLYWGLARDRAYRDYDAVVAVGEAVRRQLSAWPTSQLVGRTPVHLVANGVDARAFRFDPQARGRLRASLGLADDTPLVLFAGRLQADKGRCGRSTPCDGRGRRGRSWRSPSQATVPSARLCRPRSPIMRGALRPSGSAAWTGWSLRPG